MKTKGKHLSEDEITALIIDDGDISDEVKEHLAICSECRNAREDVEKSLRNLGTMADAFLPAMTKKVKARPNTESVAPLIWRQALVISLMLILLTLGLWQLTDKQGPTVNPEANLMADMEEGDGLFYEIFMPEESILPDVYASIAGESIEDDYNDFIDFISPEREGV